MDSLPIVQKQNVDIKDLNEDRNSRMLAAHGLEAQSKLMKMKVFLQGLLGVGVETAKNLILAGPHTVYIQDDEISQHNNRGSNFYIQEEHVQNKVTRAEACIQQLRELNSYVNVQLHQGEIELDFLSQFSIVIFTNFFDKEQLVQYNTYCRSKGIGFIYAGNLGLYGFSFVDYGDSHISFDKNGEESRNAVIVDAKVISQSEISVKVHEEHRHGFESDDYVTFREVEGMVQLNNKTFQIQVTGPFSFNIKGIENAFHFGDYLKQGIVEQVKVPITHHFKSLSESLEYPFLPKEGKNYFDICDFSKIGIAEQLHLALQAIFQFYRINKGNLPQLHNEKQAEELVQLAAQINAYNKLQYKGQENNAEKPIILDNIDVELIKNVARYARTQITPFTSFWGGIIAQEVIKFTGKFTPLKQWLHYEIFESLPEHPVDNKPVGSRYDDFLSIYGRQALKDLIQANVLLIGAGALGCEFLKLFALLGVSTQQWKNQDNSQAKIFLTDDDTIEMSNLSRQFLFRKENIGQYKSECAAKAVTQTMNKNINIDAVKLRVNQSNEYYFNCEFWENLTFVVTAVDNVQARLSLDRLCSYYDKPLFDSGTLGTKCNSQVIIPNCTQTYGESQDPKEDAIPFCTLKNFPYQIEHTIQWARDFFEGRFVQASADLNLFSQNPIQFVEKMNALQKKLPAKEIITLRERLEQTLTLASVIYSQNNENSQFNSCIKLAVGMFQELHHDCIAQLIFTLPQDHHDKNGNPFWTGTHRFPQPIYYNSNDDSHLDFIIAASNIYFYICGSQKYITDREQIRKLSSEVNIAKFIPKQNAYIKTDDKDMKQDPEKIDYHLEEIKINQINHELMQLQTKNKQSPRQIQFEKDDPTNYHVDLLSAIANLRARNYRIPEVSKFKVKIIAGKIIPALATTTAMIVGAVGIEIIKHIQKLQITKMRNAFINLALPIWIFSEPTPPKKNTDQDSDPKEKIPIKAVPNGFTNWNKIEVQGPIKVKQLYFYLLDTYQILLQSLSIGQVQIYNILTPEAEIIFEMDITQAFEKVLKYKVPTYKKYLFFDATAIFDDNHASKCKIPIIKYKLK